MSREAKQHEALQTANRTIHTLTKTIQERDRQIITCVELLDKQKDLIKELQRPVRWWQVWK